MERDSQQSLPPELVRRASLRGGEYAWVLDDIPDVIEGARAARLVSIGGQLQFRLPDGATCECYWIEVDTYQDVSDALPWDAQVELTADAARRQFAELPPKHVLVEEGRKAFGPNISEAENAGHVIDSLMCFVWYVAARNDE